MTNITDPTPPSTPHRNTPPRRSATVARSVAPRYTTPTLDELDREWQRLRRKPSTLRTVRSWAVDPALTAFVANVRDLDDLVAMTQPGATTPGHGDRALRALIARRDDLLAGRIVLQRILPGLISRSRRWAGRISDVDACDVAVGAAWMAIRHYDVARDHHVAPALIADSLWIGFRREARRKVEQEIPVPGNTLIARAAPPRVATPMAALAGTLRAAQRAGVPAAHLDLLRAVLATGSPAQVAHASGVVPRTIRNRCAVASQRIRRALGPDWADWSDPLVAA